MLCFLIFYILLLPIVILITSWFFFGILFSAGFIVGICEKTWVNRWWKGNGWKRWIAFLIYFIEVLIGISLGLAAAIVVSAIIIIPSYII